MYVTAQPTGTAVSPGVRPTRLLVVLRRHRRLASVVLWLVLGALVAYLLVPQLGSLSQSGAALRSADPGWVVLALAILGIRYAASAASLALAVRQQIPFRATLLVQVAASFVGRLTPEAIGWIVLNQRFLERVGLARSTAAAGIGLKLVAGASARVAAMAVVALIVGTSGVIRIEGDARLAVAAGTVAVVTLAALAATLARRAPGRRAPLLSAMRDLAQVLRQPLRAFALLAASVLVTLSYPLSMAASAYAVGIALSPVELTAVYFAAATVAAASPTPGNIGALELTMSAGLAAFGIAAAPAVAAVLIFRLLTFWLPIAPGFLAFRLLQRTEYL